MREKLIKIVSEKEKWLPQVGTLAAQTLRFVDHLIANGVTIQKWTPVTERLPELDKNVLMYFKDGKNMTVGCLLDTDEDRTFWMAYCDDAYYIDCDFEPTHWMPLPEAPKEENDVH